MIKQSHFHRGPQRDKTLQSVRRHERWLIVVGAVFDLTVVLLAADRWLW